MQYSKTGEQLTERFESCRLVGYADIEGVPTVGYGHTGKGVSIGMTISRQQAEQWLMEDTQHAVDTANRAVTISLTQSEFDAICDFIYNCGAAAFEDSTLLKDLNAGNYAAAANEFDKWDRAGGRVVAGILRRREAEKQEFTGAV
jgi:lysozyme